jgi:pyruvate dehydrogenase E1 component
MCMTEIMKLEDLDPTETREWIESIDSVLKTQGAERAHYLLEQLIDYTRRSGAYLPFRPNTAYVNTISPGQEPEYPGNREYERRIEAYIRWNARAFLARHLRARIPRRAPHRRPAETFPPGSRRKWPVVLSASLAHA